jgi:mannose-6-phosphate isomerase-like protein (cupin superfamily)
MRRFVIVMLLIGSSAAAAIVRTQGTRSEPDRVVLWPDAELNDLETRELIPKAKASIPRGTSVGFQQFLNTPTHTVLVSHRESTGNTPELHNGETDIMIVRSGGGVLQVGGEIVDRKENPAGATGSAIRGGTNYTLKVGDVINIPPHVAHNWLLEAGQSVTYFVVKVKTKDTRVP